MVCLAHLAGAAAAMGDLVGMAPGSEAALTLCAPARLGFLTPAAVRVRAVRRGVVLRV